MVRRSPGFGNRDSAAILRPNLVRQYGAIDGLNIRAVERVGEDSLTLHVAPLKEFSPSEVGI